LLASWVLLSAGVLLAQQKDFPGSKDHPLISRYPGSVILDYEQKQFDEYELPVGKSKDNGNTTTTHLEGKVTFIKYEYPHDRSELEVYRNYQGALQRAGFQEIFQCVDRDGCGSGDVKKLGYWGGWHNRYLATKLSRPEGDVYAAINLAQDNQHYLYMAVIEVKPMESGLITVNAASLASDITRTGHASVYGIYFDTGKADVKPESDGALTEISKLLQQDSNLKLYVVGHTDNVGTLASNMELSKRRADAVVNVLTTKLKIAAARLSAQGDGPIAPVASNDTEDGRAKNRRVELVKQ
jgi:outer membrane protein OmpA-like peptidoglycan-associated protein